MSFLGFVPYVHGKIIFVRRRLDLLTMHMEALLASEQIFLLEFFLLDEIFPLELRQRKSQNVLFPEKKTCVVDFYQEEIKPKN